MSQFTHLHVHTQYSILDGASKISNLVNKAKADGMKAIAITDHGNMFGVKDFYDQVTGAGLKPILGIEAYVARRGMKIKTDKKIDGYGYHIILLAKNEIGYKNLMKLSSAAFVDGSYFKPRIDNELLETYHEGIIVSSACLGGQLPQLIMKDRIDEAYEVAKWFKSVFNDDFYIELQRHKPTKVIPNNDTFEKQELVNKELIKIAKELDIKVIATNDVHFVDEEDAEAHDRLICLVTNASVNDPQRMRYTQEEYFKTTQQMSEIFADIPEAITNTQEIVDKVEQFELDKSPIMPDFPLPEGFNNEADYLRHLTVEGAKERWGDPLPEDVKTRVEFELDTIISMGFPGYFLIVWDFIKAARDMGVLVGPGRGSAAGSVVAYSLKITNIDPMRYDLLFERFLNPDRISMPDIDIDFDDDGRAEVLNWVVQKYGYNKVAHIITFGSMATKSSIRDVARVEDFPLSRANELAKMVPEAPKMNFEKAYKESPELAEVKKNGSEDERKVLEYAEKLEGSVRQTGVHACGIIISKDDLTEYIPVCVNKDAHLLVTQYDGRFVEPVGMLKMDFLGLKTLSIIKEALEYIKETNGFDLKIDQIPLDDPKTFELYSNGETTALFQFESPGMKKHLRALKPNRFEDLVAMNALYRPGPMEYIPSFIARKHGREKIEYDHPIMEEYLKDTYGITVYQEQVMLQSRALGGFTRGQSDSLRKAMGKKKIKLMNELKEKFIEGANANPKFVEGCKTMKKNPNDVIEKIWKDWEAFAKYAFNKSHSVCYAYVSYQTAYIKAHYPLHFMAAVLSRNLSDLTKVTTFLEEARRMKIEVKGPDVNESLYKFWVSPQNYIRFGMGAIKNVGSNVVKHIIEVRKEKGKFESIFDFVEKVDMHIVTKKNLEALAYAGALDGFGIVRNAYFDVAEGDSTFIENLIKYGNRIKEDANSQQQTLFGDSFDDFDIAKPTIPQSEPWLEMQKLKVEKEYIGVYLSAHPLDQFRFELKHMCSNTCEEVQDLESFENREVSIGGMVTEGSHLMTKGGNPFGKLKLEDYSGSFQIMMFGDDYLKFKSFIEKDYFILIKGKVQRRGWGNNDLQFKINDISLLANLKDKVKSVQISIPVMQLSNDIVNEMYNLVSNSKGSTNLQFVVFDENKNIKLQMFSKNTSIQMTQEIYDYFNNIPELQLKIN